MKLSLRSALKSCALTASLATLASPLAAQTVVGEVMGMEAIVMPDSEGIWLRSPDGKVFFNGMVYDNRTGKTVVNFGLGEAAALPAPGRPAPAPEVSAPAPIADLMPPQPAPAAQELAPATDPEQIIERAMKGAQAGLSHLDDAKKQEALIGLVARLDKATTAEEFQLTILQWQAEMAGDTEAAAAAGAEIDRLKGGAAEIDAIDHTAVDPAPHQESGMTGHAAKHSPETHDDPVALHDEAAADGEDHSDGQFLFDKMSQEGLWMAVGDAAAPVVYAFIDPMCPYCARTMVNLAPEIERGELQLRVLFAPVISKSSPGKIAAIMMSEDPANAFLSHELQYAERGASDLVSQDFNELAPELYAGIRKNYDMIFDLEIPGVPFFGYRTAEGIKFLSGVPQPGAFASALPDPSTSATH